jgi:hypothetical protein
MWNPLPLGRSSAIGKRYLKIITLEVGIQARIHVSTVTLVISSQQPFILLSYNENLMLYIFDHYLVGFHDFLFPLSEEAWVVNCWRLLTTDHKRNSTDMDVVKKPQFLSNIIFLKIIVFTRHSFPSTVMVERSLWY